LAPRPWILFKCSPQERRVMQRDGIPRRASLEYSVEPMSSCKWPMWE
jgi:hypothetical protein